MWEDPGIFPSNEEGNRAIELKLVAKTKCYDKTIT